MAASTAGICWILSLIPASGILSLAAKATASHSHCALFWPDPLHSPRCHPTRDILLDSQPLDQIPLLSCILTLLRTEVKSNSQDLPFHGPRFWLREMSLSSGTWRSLSTLAGVPGPCPPLGKWIRVPFSLSFINHNPKGSAAVSGWSGLQISRAGRLAEAPSYRLKLAEDISPDR